MFEMINQSISLNKTICTTLYSFLVCSLSPSLKVKLWDKNTKRITYFNGVQTHHKQQKYPVNYLILLPCFELLTSTNNAYEYTY